MDKAKIVKIDPYHPQLGLLVPFVMQKLMAAHEGMGEDMGVMLVQFMSNLYAQDLRSVLIAALDSSSRVIGYAAATASAGTVVMTKPRLDEPTENDAVSEMLALVEGWAKELGYRRVSILSRNYDKKWNEKHGFEVKRYIMERRLMDDA